MDCFFLSFRAVSTLNSMWFSSVFHPPPGIQWRAKRITRMGFEIVAVPNRYRTDVRNRRNTISVRFSAWALFYASIFQWLYKFTRILHNIYIYIFICNRICTQMYANNLPAHRSRRDRIRTACVYSDAGGRDF